MSRSPTSSLASYLVIAQRSGGGGTTLKFRAARSRAALSDSFRRERMKVAAAISVPGFLSGGGHLGGGHSRPLKLVSRAQGIAQPFGGYGSAGEQCTVHLV